MPFSLHDAYRFVSSALDNGFSFTVDYVAAIRRSLETHYREHEALLGTEVEVTEGKAGLAPCCADSCRE